MDVVSPLPSSGLPPPLPLLARPSGYTLKVRKRNNELDELEDEALRLQIRQHYGPSPYSTSTKPRRSKSFRTNLQLDETNEDEVLDASNSASASASLLSSTDAFDFSSIGAIVAAPSRFVRITSILKTLRLLLWMTDEDMNEEINENDPKIIAGKKFLKGIEAFSMLTENEFAQLVTLAELRSYEMGEEVVEDERQADGLYIVLSGRAARFGPNYNEGGDKEPKEVFTYQNHFGMIISPAEAAESDRDATTVVAMTDSLECLWLPEVAIRMLNIQPRMEYEFALILHNNTQMPEHLHRQQEELVARLLRAGIHVTVLANTRHTTQCIVLLLHAPLWLLAREDKIMAMERDVDHPTDEDRTSDGPNDEYTYHAETMTASDRITAFASILTRSPNEKPPGAGLSGIEDNSDMIIRDVFPLHDPSMTDFILSTWFKESHTADTKRLFLLRVKDYFGLRIAFFTAFVRLYTNALIHPMTIGLLLWLFWRWIDYRTYTKALGIYGLGVAFLWAPSFMKRWSRYQNSLLVEWKLLGTTEVEQPNREFKNYVVETINVAEQGETPDYIQVKTYDHRRRWPKYAIFIIFCCICLLLLFLFVGVYVQWYIIAVMTPMCTDPRCPAYLDADPDGPGGAANGCITHCQELLAQDANYLFMQHITNCTDYCDVTTFDRNYYRCDASLVGCFNTERGILGTGRWGYVLFQGIVLGLTLDVVFLNVFESIASGFNTWENYPTELEKEKRFIEKIFLFNWVGYFYWFFLLAFLYVPNGAQVQDFIRETIDQNWVFTLNQNIRFSRYWIDGLISMDSAFITPMIVTQALNLVINTFVPYLLRRAIIRARDSYHIKKDKLNTALAAAAAAAAARRHGGAFTRLSQSQNLETEISSPPAEHEYNTMDETLEEWVSLTDLNTLVRQDVARQLSQREPVSAEALENSIRSLLRVVSTHDTHMQEICHGQSRTDFDQFQVSSYDWIDRVTRQLEEQGQGWKGSDAKLHLISSWCCRQYQYTADRIMEESSMPIYSPFNDLLHLAIQFSYTIMFSVVWPFCCLCSYGRNYVALRFDAIKMTIDCKRAVPRQTVGIGAWHGAFLFEILISQVVVPGLFVYVGGQLDAFIPSCTISDTRYGPSPQCVSPANRLASFCSLENAGIVVCFIVYIHKSDLSHQTRVKMVEWTRKQRYKLRKTIRMIGETVLVRQSNTTERTTGISSRSKERKTNLFTVDLLQDTTPTESPSPSIVEWREGTVSWVKNGRIKVNFSTGRQLGNGTEPIIPPLTLNESERWLNGNDTYVRYEPIPVKIFEVGTSVLLASKKYGRWLEATITGLDDRDRFGQVVAMAPNEMHFRFVEAQNLRTHTIRQAAMMDPYCILSVGSPVNPATGTPSNVVYRHMTSVKRKTQNPVWDESIVFPLTEQDLRIESSSVPPSRHTSHSNGMNDRVQTNTDLMRRTLKVSVINNDRMATGDVIGDIEIDLSQFRTGQKHRLLIPLSQKRHIWTLETMQSVMRKQTLGATEYPMLGLPHLLFELQWIDTRLPTKVTVQVQGQTNDIILSRKFCETNLCYGIPAESVVGTGSTK